MSTVRGLCYPGEPTAITPDAFFARKGDQLHQQAQELCLSCPLYFTCQDVARGEGIPYGIFGGETPRDRERYWMRNGGKPDHFIRVTQQAANALLQERRDHENFDSRAEAYEIELAGRQQRRDDEAAA